MHSKTANTAALHADFLLAKRLEETEIAVSTHALDRWVERHAELGATAASIAGGRAIFFGSASPLSQALGIGMNGPVSTDDFERLETFFVARSTPVVISLCPFADPTVLSHIHERKYRITHFENTLIFDLQAQPLPPVTGSVRLVGPDARDIWCRAVMLGFSEGEPVSDDTVRMFAAYFGAGSLLAWAAYDEHDEIKGGAASCQIGDSVMFCGDSTLPDFRKRGAHGGLIAARLRHAAEAGCNLAIACTLPGSTSQRNYERAGFRVAYTKTMLARDSF